MNARAVDRAWNRFLLLGAAILVFYGVLLWAPMIYDDRILILGNPRITGPWGGFRAALFLPGEYAEAWEPLVVFLHRILYAVSGEAPFLYRLTSLLLHWANAGLVLALYSRFVRDRRLAFLAALLFAVFPAHVDILAGSTFKKHLLIAFFTLSALWLLDFRTRAVRLKTAVLWLLFALALLCKESALILPALAGARLLRQSRKEASLDEVSPAVLFGGWAVLLAGCVLLRSRIGLPALHPLAGGTPLTHALTSAKILAWYGRHLVWPFPLSLEHSLSPAGSPLDAAAWLAAAGAALALGGLFVLYRRDRNAWFAAAWILLALAPFLNLISSLNYSLVADRYLYTASIGFFLLAALALERFLAAEAGRRFRPLAVPALAGLAAVYACGGLRYAATFSDPREVWANAVRQAPGNPRAHSAYGSVLRQAGENEAAAAEFRRAIEVDPAYPEAYFELAGVASGAGRPAEAAELADEGVRRRPDAAGWQILGIYRLRAGLTEPALEALRKAAALAPEDPAVRLALGTAEAQARLWDAAQADLQYAAGTPGLRARALAGLGDVSDARGRPAEGAALFESARALDPWNPSLIDRLARDYVLLGRKMEALKLYDDLLAGLDAALARPGRPESDRGLAALRDAVRKQRASLLDVRR